MSFMQTCFLAHIAQDKLSREARSGDRHLRLLVGHANMLGCLMVDLANARQEGETWFRQSRSGPGVYGDEDEDGDSDKDEDEKEVEHLETIIPIRDAD
jgi:hypothetical protein